jgi:hypothetical protein
LSRTLHAFQRSARRVRNPNANARKRPMLLQRQALSAVRLGGGSHDRHTAARFCRPTPLTAATLPGYHAGRPPRNKG